MDLNGLVWTPVLHYVMNAVALQQHGFLLSSLASFVTP